MSATDPVIDPIKSSQATNAIRDLSGKFSKVDPPFVSFSITNPVTYIRKWWKSVMDGEGVDLKLKIHPMTAVLIVLAVGGASFGIGRLVVPAPILKYIPILATPLPTASPNPWVETALNGILQKQGTQYYLVGTQTQAIRLEVPTGVLLDPSVGKRILATGEFNATTQVLKVSIASNIEVVSGIAPMRTALPSPVSSASAETTQEESGKQN